MFSPQHYYDIHNNGYFTALSLHFIDYLFLNKDLNEDLDKELWRQESQLRFAEGYYSIN